MDSFKKRTDDFEKKFSHDEEKRFKVQSRCARLLGIWAAEKLNMDKAEADEYARDIVALSLQKAGLQGIKNKVYEDLHARDQAFSEHMLDNVLAEKMDEAEKQITGE